MPAYPDFDSLPKVEGQPQGNAWGLWGENDELGTLNYLTPDLVLAATKEIKAGITLQLDLPLNHFIHLGAGRQEFGHQIIDFKERLKGTDLEIIAHDDVLTLNTQSSSQWDGLRHIGLQESGTYYRGMKHRDIDEKREDGKLGIHKWVERGGIVGRGVLLDYRGWRQQTGQPPVTINSNTAITLEELESVAKHQGTQFRDGDILVLRTGFTEWHLQASQKEQEEASRKGAFIGIEATEKSVKWLWNHHFAAVATDTLGFEVTPIPFLEAGAVRLHEWLLVHWGTPIGELWNLESLANVCRERRQWSFFLTSAPLHVYGGVGTPPNAIAVL